MAEIRGSRAPTCRAHPSERAGWWCQTCGAELCPACTAMVARRFGEPMYTCCLCGGLAAALTVHRAQASFFSRLLQVPAYPFTRAGLGAIAALAFILALFSYAGGGMLRFTFSLPVLGVVLAGRGVFWAAMFSIIKSTGAGSRTIETPDFSDLYDSLVLPAIRGAVATSLVWLPAFLYLWFSTDASVFAVTSRLATDPVVWLLVAIGIVYVPMATLAAATDVTMLDVLNPLKVFTAIVRVGRNYWVLVAAMVVLGLADAVFEFLGGVVAGLPVPLLSRVLSQAVTLYVPILMARSIGLLLYVHGDAVGYGASHEYEDPVLAGVEPHGTPPSTPRSAMRPVRGDAIDLGTLYGDGQAPDVAPGAAFTPPGFGASGPAAHPAVGRLAFAAPAAPEVDAVVVDAIGEALRTGNVLRALSLYASVPAFPERTLSPAQHFAVGHAAAKGRDFKLAARALEAASTVIDDPAAPRALVALAQVHGDGLKDAAAAEKTWTQVIQRYPGTPFADFARKRMPGAGGPG